MEIRKAELQDAAEIYTCCIDAFKDYITLIEKTPAPMLIDYYETLKHDTVFVACIDQKIVGFAYVKNNNPRKDYLWLEVLAVRSQFQMQGIGSALIKYSEDYIRAVKGSECRLYTNVMFKKTCELYLHHGYIIYEKVSEMGFNRFYMKKDLRK